MRSDGIWDAAMALAEALDLWSKALTADQLEVAAARIERAEQALLLAYRKAKEADGR